MLVNLGRDALEGDCFFFMIRLVKSEGTNLEKMNLYPRKNQYFCD